MITIPSENQYIKEGLLLSFKNSSIGIFDFSKKRLDFVTEPSHSETIFDLKFSNINKNILASGSYDGSVKIWDINKMTCLSTLMNSNTEKKLNPLYGLSWSPKNNEIVTVHSNGEMALWDCDKNKLLSLVKPGKGLAIYRVEWNKIKTDLIASGSTENFA